MSLRLWFESFDWHRFDGFLRDTPDDLAELLTAEITCERQRAAAEEYESYYDVLPQNAKDLNQAIRHMIDAEDWYACFENESWASLDLLFWQSFSSRGFLGAELGTKPRANGIAIETADVACPGYPHALRSETYRMGHRRFRHDRSPVYPDETSDDPGYSIHNPEQVRQVLLELSEFDYDGYPDEGIKRNFRDDFLQPIQYCSEQGLAILSRWS